MKTCTRVAIWTMARSGQSRSRGGFEVEGRTGPSPKSFSGFWYADMLTVLEDISRYFGCRSNQLPLISGGSGRVNIQRAIMPIKT